MNAMTDQEKRALIAAAAWALSDGQDGFLATLRAENCDNGDIVVLLLDACSAIGKLVATTADGEPRRAVA